MFTDARHVYFGREFRSNILGKTSIHKTIENLTMCGSKEFDEIFIADCHGVALGSHGVLSVMAQKRWLWYALKGDDDF